MNGAELAALIAAAFWVPVACAGTFALLRIGRLASQSSRLLRRGDVVLQRAQAAVDGAQAAVDRAARQLERTESVTASMDELSTGMTELAGQVALLARGVDPAHDRWGSAPPGPPGRPPREGIAAFGQALAAGPVGRAGALAYGLRHAVALRSSRRRRALPGSVEVPR
jgi:outer membrane murein-binding lipoprotein Lpp